jgi:hypothetical protein
MNPKAGSIPKMPAYFPLAIANDKNKIGYPRFACCQNKVFHHRAIGKGQHYFWAFCRKGTHPLPFSCGKNDTFHT